MNDRPSIICMYVPTADGGHALYAHELMLALCAADTPLRFELVTASDLAPQYESGVYPVHRILPPLRERNTYSNRLTWAAGRISYYSRREITFLKWLESRPDITAVHLQEWKAWLLPSLVKRIVAQGKRVFATVHNVYPHRYPAGVPRSLVDGFVRRGCRRCSGLFVHSPRLSRELAGFLGRGAPPIHVVPHGVWARTADRPMPPLAERLTARKLLFFGVLRRNKGLDILLRAAELMPEFSLTIAGAPEEPEYYQNVCLPLIRKLQASGIKVDVRAGFIPDDETERLMASHSAVMLPYTDQFVAQSGVAYLAIAHELPVIATRAGGLGDLLEEYHIGAVCDRATPESIATATRSLFAHPDAEVLLKNLRAVGEHYSWRSAAEATLRGYAAAGIGAEVFA